MKYIRIVNYLKDQRFNNLDLLTVMIMTILSVIFILIPPFNQTFLRFIFAPPLLLFLPGYMLIVAMFPRRGELRAIERFTLGIGLSIAITVFDGFGLNYTRWGFRPNSIAISLSIIIGLLLIITILQRRRCRKESYNFSLEDIRGFINILKTKETETGTDPALEKMLLKTMIIAILIVTAMLIYVKVTQEPEKFTVLYILGENGKAENYPAEVSVGEPSTILVGVENHEYAKVNYSLIVKLEGIDLTKENIYLGHGDKWLKNVTFVPQLTSSIALAGANKSKLEFQLLKDNMPYRSVYLLVNAGLDSVKFAELPQVVNGNMESNKGWEFSGSSPNIIGGYNNSNVFSSRVYEINFSSKSQGSKGVISQNFTINGSSSAVLSFDIKDSWSDISNYTYKQALLDNKVLWESKVGIRNNSWEHVEVPVFLSSNGTFSLGIFGRYLSDDNVTVWIDNVDLIPYSPTGKDENNIKLPRIIYDFNFDIMGEPRRLEKNMRINGFDFPGFDYNIDKNFSYEELTFNVSGTNETNPIIGIGNATYISRVNGSDIKLMGSEFRIQGKDMPTNLSRKMEIPSTISIKPDSRWEFGRGYTIDVDLISSLGGTAFIYLKKNGLGVDYTFIKNGIYEYRKDEGEFQALVFRTKVSITAESVNFTDMELYSDEITDLKLNESYGEFEVVNISSDEIVFKNRYPIELKDKTSILKGSAGIRISGDKLYPYTSNVELRGTPQYINSGRWMNISGYNYPGFYFENDTSYEDLHIYFTGNGSVIEGDATYVSKVHNGKISFLGNTYELKEPNRPGYISNVTLESQIKLVKNETKEFEGYNFNFSKINNDSIQLSIRKMGTNNQTELLKRTLDLNISSILESGLNNTAVLYPDINYFMLTGSNNKLRTSNILKAGEIFEYWNEFRVDYNYKKIAGRLESINNSNLSNINVNLSVIFYDVPFEIFPGKVYGDFKVYSISNNSIVLKNTKPLLFARGKEVPLLGGAMKIRTSTSEFLAYPEK